MTLERNHGLGRFDDGEPLHDNEIIDEYTLMEQRWLPVDVTQAESDR
jgi:hypothetical protein